jgi:hypothetical protein
MKRLLSGLLVVAVCSVAHAGYDYVIEEGRYGLPSLEDYETLLMTGGGGRAGYDGP